MTSDLSIFAARLRDFISICAEEPAFGVPSRQGADASSHDTALRAHRDAEFNGMALVLFALQFNRNPAYRKFCDARKTLPDSISHWTQIPAAPASAFKDFEMTCLSAAERTAVFHSSGTTEQHPSRHFHSAESLATYEASLWPWFAEHVLPELRIPDREARTARDAENADPQSAIGPAKREQSAILLAPPPAQAPHSSLAHMFATVWSSVPPFAGRSDTGLPSREARDRTPNDAFCADVSPEGAWILNAEKVLRALERAVRDGRPLALLGTAFSFVHLLDHLAEHDLSFKLPPGSRVMETGGYKGRSRSLPKADLHALITQRLGVPASHIVCEYGMSELSSQAYDGEVRSLKCEVRSSERIFRFPPWARAQIISPETGREAADGETGLIRVFDLANVFSVMAIQTEDLAVRRGDGFELVGRVESAEPRGCSLMAQDA